MAAVVLIAIALAWDIVFNDGDAIANIVGAVKGKKNDNG